MCSVCAPEWCVCFICPKVSVFAVSSHVWLLCSLEMEVIQHNVGNIIDRGMSVLCLSGVCVCVGLSRAVFGLMTFAEAGRGDQGSKHTE